MTRYVLDTNHAGTLLRDPAAPLWRRLAILTRPECLLCRPVVGELWYMIHNSERADANRPKLEALLLQFDIVEFDAKAAEEFGKIRAELRRTGTPVPSFDALIAALCRSNNFTLVTADKHFRHISGLKTDNWLLS